MSGVKELELGDISTWTHTELPGDFSSTVTLVVSLSIQELKPLADGRPSVWLYWATVDTLQEGETRWNVLDDINESPVSGVGFWPDRNATYDKQLTKRYIQPLGSRVGVRCWLGEKGWGDNPAPKYAVARGVKLRWLAREMA